jgi:hypothetical protein
MSAFYLQDCNSNEFVDMNSYFFRRQYNMLSLPTIACHHNDFEAQQRVPEFSAVFMKPARKVNLSLGLHSTMVGSANDSFPVTG